MSLKSGKSRDFYLISEVAQAHDGSLGAAHAFIDISADSGADAVKFQMHIADVESGPEETWRYKFSLQDESRQDYWRRMEFTLHQWQELKTHCEARGVDFLCSPFTQMAAEQLKGIGVKNFKIASGEVNNYLLLDYLNNFAHHLVLSSGMSDVTEIANALSRITKPEERVSLLQCTTLYPTPMSEVGINLIQDYQELFNVKHVGLSDHSGEITPSLLAYAMGASVFEVHICLHKQQFGPDTVASLTPEQMGQLTAYLEDFSKMKGAKVKKDIAAHQENRVRFGKSLIARQTIKKGQKINSDMLETRKPYGLGIPPMDYEIIVGQSAPRAFQKGELIKLEDFND